MTPIPSLDLLYQDDDLVVVNKPPGLISESRDPDEDSLVRRVTDRVGRPATLYHRLDRLTSGCILLGKTARFNRAIGLLFENKQVRKEYWAVVGGTWPKGLNRIETRLAPLGGGRWENREREGKLAVTTFRVVKRVGDRTCLQVLPKTGRTHQIRLHCLHAGCPIVGDTIYGNPDQTGPLMLHARKMGFRHPVDGRTVEVEALFPDYWEQWSGIVK